MNARVASSTPIVSTCLPRVTIVTVVRNACGTIRDTIDSVLMQTCSNLEHWVIDGASDDGTVGILKSYGPRLTHWVSEPDCGIADGFNKALKRATGEYVMFLNADDALADQDAVRRVMEFAAQQGYPDVIYGDCDLYDHESGRWLYRACIEYNRAALLRGQMLPHPGMFLHRRYFERFGRFDTSFQIAMDYELLLRGVPEVGATRVPFLVTRVRTGGASTRNRELVLDEIVRALAKNKRFHFWFEPLVLRNRYVIRYWLRKAAEALGLYGLWLERKRRPPQAVDAESRNYGTDRSA